MKKVIGIFMAMVFVFVFGSMAFAREIADVSGSKAYELTREWAKAQGYEDWYYGTGDGIVYRGCASLSIRDFKNETGMEYSIDNFEKMVTKEFDLCECRIWKRGEIEGYDVYMIEAQSETKVVGKNYNFETGEYDEYYCASMLFMVCE